MDATGPGNQHVMGMMACLTAQNTRGKTPAGPSIEFAMGKRLKGVTPFECLQFGVMSRSAQLGNDRILSYRELPDGTTEGVFAEDNPAAMYARLFMNVGGADAAGAAALDKVLAQDKSVLDFVADEYKGVALRLGAADRQRLEEHATFLRSIETRLTVKVCKRPTPISTTSPNNFRAVAEAQTDLIAAAFACDLVRSVTLQFAGAESSLDWARVDPSFKIIAGRTDALSKAGETASGWHQVSHLPTNWDLATAPEIDRPALDFLVRTQIWLAERLASLARKLKSYTDADGRSVLDNSAILWTSEVAEGNHSLKDMPLTVVGNMGGALKSNLHLAYKGRQHGDVLATMAIAMGLTGFERFGRQGYTQGVFTDWLR
jgi:hypothetical protein